MGSQDFSKKLLDNSYVSAYKENLEAKDSEISKKVNEYKKLRDKENEYDITDIEKLFNEQLTILENQLIIFEMISSNLKAELDTVSKDEYKIAEVKEKRETIELLNSMKNGVIVEIIKFKIYFNESQNRISDLLKKHQINIQDNCI